MLTWPAAHADSTLVTAEGTYERIPAEANMQMLHHANICSMSLGARHAADV